LHLLGVLIVAFQAIPKAMSYKPSKLKEIWSFEIKGSKNPRYNAILSREFNKALGRPEHKKLFRGIKSKLRVRMLRKLHE